MSCHLCSTSLSKESWHICIIPSYSGNWGHVPSEDYYFCSSTCYFFSRQTLIERWAQYEARDGRCTIIFDEKDKHGFEIEDIKMNAVSQAIRDELWRSFSKIFVKIIKIIFVVGLLVLISLIIFNSSFRDHLTNYIRTQLADTDSNLWGFLYFVIAIFVIFLLNVVLAYIISWWRRRKEH